MTTKAEMILAKLGVANEDLESGGVQMMHSGAADLLTRLGIKVKEVADIEGDEGSTASGTKGMAVYFEDSMIFNKTGQAGVITLGDGILTVDLEEDPNITKVYSGDVYSINDAKNALLDPTGWEDVSAEEVEAEEGFDPEEDETEGDIEATDDEDPGSDEDDDEDDSDEEDNLEDDNDDSDESVKDDKDGEDTEDDKDDGEPEDDEGEED